MIKSGDEIRQAYLDFFAEKQHLILDSAPLVPKNDPSLLWINAGMAPFKKYFDGTMEPPQERIATSQKCIRTNDIENVGKTARHHTYFEMLGNFSFGNYFKEEAITWAWEFVTKILKLEEERLWITIYKDDDRSFEIWHDQVGLPEERIIRMGKKDNFWQIGTGPCGPCSEIHYDRGEAYGNSDADIIGGDGDRFLEIWNLVFTQYNYTEDGEYLNLPNKNIDTGMGLERVASLLQGTESNFETDLLKPIIDWVVKDCGIAYKQDEETITAYRVISDHSRSSVMAIFDGALPANEGRGYVIRRLIRRAVRYGRKLGYHEPFLYRIVPIAAQVMQGVSPEIVERVDYIANVIKAEEESFLQTLDQGLNILEKMVDKMKQTGQKELTGKEAFKLYDTYGFPLDLTEDILEEEGLQIDESGFNSEMDKQRARARAAREETSFSSEGSGKVFAEIASRAEEIEFTGYGRLSEQSKLLGIVKNGQEVDTITSGEKAEIILEQTPFYAESGGQVGDQGLLRLGDSKAQVVDTYLNAGVIVHQVEVESGKFRKNQEVEAVVYKDIRNSTARHHSATHLLHKALKEVLGDHVNQSGSLVGPDRLRFDFSHFSALTDAELKKVEQKVNEMILANLAVETKIKTIDEAKDMGAMALFGEKYGEEVRVISMGDYSLELCGGTHVAATGEIGLFKLISENGIAAGVRRIEAAAGHYAYDLVNKKENLLTKATDLLKTNQANLISRIEQVLAEEKSLQKEVDSLKDRLANAKKGELIDQVEEIAGVNLLATEVKDMDTDGLRSLADQLIDKVDSAIIVLGSRDADKIVFVAMVSKGLIKEGFHAGKMIGQIAKVAGGGGGGRPDMAQAGGKSPEKMAEALQKAREIVKNFR